MDKIKVNFEFDGYGKHKDIDKWNKQRRLRESTDMLLGEVEHNKKLDSTNESDRSICIL